jgi:hypothetical protein
MRIVSSIALAAFLASIAVTTDAFGPASPLRPTAFGVRAGSSGSSPAGAAVSNSGGGSGSDVMTMRIGFTDLARKQRINDILHSNPTMEVVRDVLLAPETSVVLQKCNWKVRNALIRKIKQQAARYDLDVDPKFGIPYVHKTQLKLL